MTVELIHVEGSDKPVKVFSNKNGTGITADEGMRLMPNGSKRFVKGWKGGPGRPKGSRNKLTQAFLDRVKLLEEDGGFTMEEILISMARDEKINPELRVKAAAKILDLTLPKASSIEVKMDENDALTPEQLDRRLLSLLEERGVNVEGEEESTEHSEASE